MILANVVDVRNPIYRQPFLILFYLMTQLHIVVHFIRQKVSVYYEQSCIQGFYFYSVEPL